LSTAATTCLPLSPTVRALLQQICQRQTASQRLVRRAQLLLALADHPSVAHVARQLRLTRTTVRLWRERWLQSLPTFPHAEPEGAATAAHQLAWLEACLDDAPRPGAPATFTPEQIVQIVALACEPPEQSGRPISHWTARELADEAQKRQIVPHISTRSVGLFLKSGRFTTAPQSVLAKREPGRPRRLSPTSGRGL
jgi:putative transposase